VGYVVPGGCNLMATEHGRYGLFCTVHHNTFTPSLHLVPFCQLCKPTKWTHHQRHLALLTPQLSAYKTTHMCHFQKQ